MALQLASDRALRIFGSLALTYALFPEDERRTRLVARVVVPEPEGARDWSGSGC